MRSISRGVRMAPTGMVGPREAPGERRRLDPLLRVLAGGQRHQDVAGEVREQGPEEAVAQGVEPRETEDCRRAEPGLPERARLQDRRTHHAFLHQHGHDQRVEPQPESGRDAGERATPVPARPHEPEQDRRGALRHRDEGQEAHLHQQEASGRQRRPAVSEEHDQEDAQPHRAEARAVDVAAPVAKQDRHDDVVRQHLRQCERVDDDHGGRRREAAEEHQDRQRLVPRRQGQKQHELVRLRPGAASGARRWRSEGRTR